MAVVRNLCVGRQGRRAAKVWVAGREGVGVWKCFTFGSPEMLPSSYGHDVYCNESQLGLLGSFHWFKFKVSCYCVDTVKFFCGYFSIGIEWPVAFSFCNKKIRISLDLQNQSLQGSSVRHSASPLLYNLYLVVGHFSWVGSIIILPLLQCHQVRGLTKFLLSHHLKRLINWLQDWFQKCWDTNSEFSWRTSPRAEQYAVCQICPHTLNHCQSLFLVLWSFCVWPTLCRGWGMFYLGLGYSKIHKKKTGQVSQLFCNQL